MSIGITDSMWQQLRSEYNSRKLTALNSYSGSSATQSQNAAVQIDTGSNTCTDGADDGHIGFFSKVGNFFEGIGNSVVGMAKNIVKHPFKTLAVVGACCVPVVGPAIAGGLAAYGAYQGAKTIYNGVQVANSATTDAEAKAAWENIGSGTFTTAASAVALKGSASVLKSQLAGGEGAAATVQAFKANKGAEAETLFKEVGSAAVKDTMGNIEAVGKATVGRAYDKGRAIYKSVQENGIKQTVSEGWSNLTNKAVETAGKAGQKIGEKIDNFKANKANKSAQKLTKEEFNTTVEELKLDGYKVKKLGNTTKLTRESDGHILEFNNNGQLKSQTVVENGSTVKYNYNRSGNIVKKETISETTQGAIKTENKTVENYDKSGEIIKSTKEQSTIKQEVLDKDGNAVVGKNNAKKYETVSKETTVKRGDYQSITKTSKEAKTTTEFTYKNTQLTSRLQKAWARYKTSAVSPTIDKFIDMQVQLGNITVSDVALMDLEALLLDNDD